LGARGAQLGNTKRIDSVTLRCRMSAARLRNTKLLVCVHGDSLALEIATHVVFPDAAGG
jgi:hypothetical protein